ncbi:MAG: hypothetical protein MZV63_30810 [Marinilabiliales bacterium]|nr:hypothetical protein [Marinilabiliales bacterium]
MAVRSSSSSPPHRERHRFDPDPPDQGIDHEPFFPPRGEGDLFCFSAGIADSSELNPLNTTLESMVDIADRRLYKAKQTVRNRIVIDDNTDPA